MRNYLLWFMVLSILFSGSSIAQDDEIMPFDDGWYVFLEPDIDPTERNRLIFVNALTGEENELEHYGQRYTIVRDSVIFWDYSRQRVMIAETDGGLREHPFIQPNLETLRIDWAVSEDHTQIAWTLTNIDENDFLSTITTVANIDGSNARIVLTDGPRADGRRMLPLEFNQAGTILYMDVHLEGLDRFFQVRQYVNIFALDLSSGTQSLLPDEVTFYCICGADISGDTFLRLRLNSFTSNFDLHVYGLVSELSTIVEAVTFSDDYLFAGDMLISDDERFAVYGLSEVFDIGETFQSSRTDFILVDLDTMTQETLLLRRATNLLRPVAWTENNTAILFTSYEADDVGTWKVSLADRRLVRIADANYVGIITVR